jgi:hypothetical protein
MTDLRTRLRDALRDEEDERLSVDEAAAMRRVVVAAARDGEREPARMWLPPLAVAATLVAMVAIGIAIGQRFDDRPAPAGVSDGTDGDLPARQAPGRARQLHFSTPGGTRIIWIFNSDLDLKTTP